VNAGLHLRSLTHPACVFGVYCSMFVLVTGGAGFKLMIINNLDGFFDKAFYNKMQEHRD
jgi:type IV secretory pathway VirB3-like protein